MKSSKKRRESGRVYNKFYDPDNGYYNKQYWDDWIDHRDGFRNISSDGTKKKPNYIKTQHWSNKILSRNKKINNEINIRKARKNSLKYKNSN